MYRANTGQNHVIFNKTNNLSAWVPVNMEIVRTNECVMGLATHLVDRN